MPKEADCRQRALGRFFCKVILCCGTLLGPPSSVSAATAGRNGALSSLDLLGGSSPFPRARIWIDEAGFVVDDDEEDEPNPFLGEDLSPLDPTASITGGIADIAKSAKGGILEKTRKRQSFYRPRGLFLLDEDSSSDINGRCFMKNDNKNSKFKPTLLSTGTTIAGVCGYNADGQPFVVLGADTRATADRMVADKRCQKIHCLASNLWCCGAGTAADLDQVTRQCRYSLALQSLVERESIGNANTKQWKPLESTAFSSHLERTAEHCASMALACRLLRDVLFESGGSVGANLIVGGIDEETGVPQIRAIHPGGSMDSLSYAALGSGGLAAMAVIESRYRNDINLEEGIQIVKEAILSGIKNDMGSGSQVDLCIITTTKPSEGSSNIDRLKVVADYTRAAVPEEEIPQGDGSTEAWKSNKTEPNDNISGNKESNNGIQDRPESIPGVNGFGTYPYMVRSKRQVLQSRQKAEQERLNKWEEFLGIPKQKQNQEGES